eukprot:9039542-Pyramimonas_sp.AAC.1
MAEPRVNDQRTKGVEKLMRTASAKSQCTCRRDLFSHAEVSVLARVSTDGILECRVMRLEQEI